MEQQTERKILFWLAMLGGIAAIATIYQVAFQSPAPVKVEAKISAEKPAAKFDPAKDLEAFINIGATGGNVFSVMGSLVLQNDDVQPLDSVNVGVGAFRNARLADFATSTFGYVRPSTYQTLNMPKIEMGDELVVCIDLVADGKPVQVVELRGIPAASSDSPKDFQAPQRRKPVVRTVNGTGCNDPQGLEATYNEVASR